MACWWRHNDARMMCFKILGISCFPHLVIGRTNGRGWNRYHHSQEPRVEIIVPFPLEHIGIYVGDIDSVALSQYIILAQRNRNVHQLGCQSPGCHISVPHIVPVIVIVLFQGVGGGPYPCPCFDRLPVANYWPWPAELHSTWHCCSVLVCQIHLPITDYIRLRWGISICMY